MTVTMTMPPKTKTVAVTSLVSAANGLWRTVAALATAMVVFGVVLLLFGKDPLQAYADIYSNTIGSRYGFSEVLVKMIPLLLCALAVLLPARLGLVNVGGEGQLYLGAWLATWGALTFGNVPQLIGVPLVFLLGFLGGGLWALLPAFLRAKGWLNEVISTLLLNYVAIQLINYFIYGIWRDPESANFPQTVKFADSYRIPQLFGTRVHLTLVVGLAIALLIFLLLRYTRWGYAMRAIGGNAEAAQRHGFPIMQYILVTMMIAGGLAGLAGVGEVMAIQGRLRPGFSPGYGYIGFLISWLANHNPFGAIVMAFLLAIIALGGDTLQITQSVPFATVNILMAAILIVVLGNFFGKRGSRSGNR
ncbi:MAG TPA: ABC transporter permease [Caldilineaceae bacterium]|nr:ABC transporter permease [Caldilineaceae bacterium]HRW06237.1 ABC transporter permease [Caldilineaceae bacterium]